MFPFITFSLKIHYFKFSASLECFNQKYQWNVDGKIDFRQWLFCIGSLDPVVLLKFCNNERSNNSTLRVNFAEHSVLIVKW